MRCRAFAFVAATVLSSCADPTVPQNGASFALVSIGGQPLPAPTLATSTDTIFADSITVTWFGAYRSAGRIDHRLLTRGGGPTPEIRSFAETIRTDGDAIVFVPSACGDPYTDCIYAAR